MTSSVFISLLVSLFFRSVWASGDFCDPSVKSLFRLSEEVLEDIVPISLLFLFLILITLFLKFIFEKLERAAHHFDHCKAVLDETVKELMLLGIVSFIVFVLKDSKFLCLLPQRYFSLEEIEIVHIFLFFVGVIYIILAITLLIIFRLTGSRWKDFESKNDDEVAVAAEYFMFTHHWWYFFSPFYLAKYWYTSNSLNFRIIRKNFIAYNDLPHNFDFARYLRKCLRRNVVHLLEIHWTIWAVFLFIISANTLRYLVEVYLHDGTFPTGKGGETNFSVISASMDVVLILICMKCSYIEHKLTSRISTGSFSSHDKFVKLEEYGDEKPSMPNRNSPESSSRIFQKELTAAFYLEESDSRSSESSSDLEARVEREKLLSQRRVQRDSLVRVAPLFLWGRPGLMFRFVQLITFYNCCHVVMFIMFLAESISVDHDGFALEFIVYTLYVLPCALAFIIILGFTLPRYVLISSINDLTKKDLLQHMLTKQILKQVRKHKKHLSAEGHESEKNMRLALELAGKMFLTKHEGDDDIDQDIQVRKKKHH